LFSEPITVSILFRYSNTEVNGNPLPSGVIARSGWGFNQVPWATFLDNLQADYSASNDAYRTSANASLPAAPLSTYIDATTANQRAVGMNQPGFLDANGGLTGTFDGIVTLNSNQPFQFTRPPNASNYDALRATEHEIDEVLGLGSYLNLPSKYQTTGTRPQDLFSWSSPGTRNLMTTGSRYFSINSGNTNIVDFNQTSGRDFGDWLSDSCPQSNPYVQNAFGCKGQFSDVTGTSPEGINLDVIGYDLVTSSGGTQTQLGNLSTRLSVGTDDNVLIGGFAVRGTQPKKVIVRASGPSLTQYNVPNVLPDPMLELHDNSGVLIATNDNWQTTQIGGIITSDQVSDIQNSGFAPSQPAESAIIATLPSGNYTAIVRGVNRTTGNGRVEVFDLDRTVDSKLTNVSTRGFVQTGDNVMIGGMAIQGTNAMKVIVRGIGSSLTQHGVSNALADPTLELHDASGTLIATNDNWQTTQIGGIITSDQVTEIQNSGFAPSDPNEAAIIATLPPGNYTGIVRGKNNTSGVGLVEAFQLGN
jgi:hypothetical protein